MTVEGREKRARDEVGWMGQKGPSGDSQFGGGRWNPLPCPPKSGANKSGSGGSRKKRMGGGGGQKGASAAKRREVKEWQRKRQSTNHHQQQGGRGKVDRSIHGCWMDLARTRDVEEGREGKGPN